MLDESLTLYDFTLPPAQIAQRPAARRDASRLMRLVGDAPPTHHAFAEFAQLLQPGDLLVRNDTRVIPARLLGVRETGGKAELLLTHETESETDSPRWHCLARPLKQLAPGKTISFGAGRLVATIIERLPGGRVVVDFQMRDDEPFAATLAALGEVPLPPYIDRLPTGPDALDHDRYQTIYATTPGAVAAPTAGLHFTPAVEADLAACGIEIAHLTLHVGPGTFRPVSVDTLDQHVMDAEWYQISHECASTINQARQSGRRIIATGTTATRTLEAATDANGLTHAGERWTDIFIRPGYTFNGIDGLLTNFHLPKSSLLVLIAAFIGRERVLAAYEEAVREQYRFYSYGDAMLLLP